MYDRILVPLDGSEMAAAAIPVAARLPSRHVRLLQVEPNFQGLAPDLLPDLGSDRRVERAAQIRAELATLAAPLQATGAEVELAVRFGDPAEEIIAATEDVDLVVMTTRGRGAAGRAIFGSTADRVARHGAAPTLLLRAGASETALATPARIVVPLDGSKLAEAALPAAARLADSLGLPLHLVRVVDLDEVFSRIGRRRPDARGPEPDTNYEEARAAREQAAADYLAGPAERLRSRGFDATTEVQTGTPAFVLLDLAQPDDVIVMTSQGEGGVRRWLLGSVAEKLVREAVAPVLLVRGAASEAAA